MDALRYWGRVAACAFSQTLRFLGVEDRKRAIVPLIGFGTAIVVVRYLGGSEQMSDELRWGIATLVAAGVVFIPTFAANLILAPPAIDREQRDRLKELSPKLILDLVPRVIGKWVYIAVTNHGEADKFVAKVLEAVKDDDMVTPWSMKWRQWKEESRPILKDDTLLLEVGSAILTDARDENLRYARWFGYHLLSTTAEFKSGWWVKHYWGKDDKIEDPTPEEELKVQLGLYVEVRGEQHNAEGGGWLCLGFDPEGYPIATIEESDPMQSAANTGDSQSQSA